MISYLYKKDMKLSPVPDPNSDDHFYFSAVSVNADINYV